MSALAMILTAAMAVPGDGPEKVSMEMVRGLDLSGEWEGTSTNGSWSCAVRLVNDKMTEGDAAWCSATFKVVDEGGGKLHIPCAGG